MACRVSLFIGFVGVYWDKFKCSDDDSFLATSQVTFFL